MATTPPLTSTGSVDVHALEREAKAILAETLRAPLHLPGERKRHRLELIRAIAVAQEVINRAHVDDDTKKTVAGARLTLVKAYAARARNARYGAGQISQGSQRAPTCEECDDGWERVEEIVSVAEAAAIDATRVAEALDTAAGWEVAHDAQSAAKDSRRIIDERNHAYTFHTTTSFSFGEGWYLAAAATVAPITIQVEPGQPQTEQAKRFLKDAGLGEQLVPYRTRPRSNKHLPEIIAGAFRAAPGDVQRKLRARFLGDGQVPKTISDWCDSRLTNATSGKKVLLWIRDCSYHSVRNTRYPELFELSERMLAQGLVPIFVGDALPDGDTPKGTIDMTLFWKLPIFQGVDMRRAQLKLFEYLRGTRGLVGQLGVTSAGMDGPALMGLATMYLTDEPNDRLGRWVGAIPAYQEVVRDETYLSRISQTLKQWASGE